MIFDEPGRGAGLSGDTYSLSPPEGQEQTQVFSDTLERETVADRAEKAGASAGGTRDRALAPRLDGNEMGGSEHFVQLYEKDAALVDVVSSYIGAGLRADEAGIVIATGPHRQAIEERLRARGLDLAALTASGEYVALDAAELLWGFMVDGAIQPTIAAETIGAIIRRAAGDGRPIRIFGEMVAILWEEENFEAALQLEEVWNDLGRTHAFSLCCGYPMSAFGSTEHGARLGEVCAAHSRVVPTETYNKLESADERLRAIALLQQKAMLLEAEIAARKQVEEQLRESESALSRSLHMRDAFLSSISHELKTPVTVLLGHTQLLQRRAGQGSLDEEVLRQGLQHIVGRSHALAELVDEFLDVTRLQGGTELPFNPWPVDLVATVQEVVSGLNGAAATHRLVIRIEEPDIIGLWDPVRVRRVVENLLSNALKYSPEGSEITVALGREAGPEHDEAVLTVQDRGMGIPEADLPHIFRPFYRGRNGSEMADGTGVGLSSIRQIVEHHGGGITVASTEGTGSTFTVRLPLPPGPGNEGRAETPRVV